MAQVVRCSNASVTNFYMELIGTALAELDIKVNYCDSIEEVYSCPKGELIIVARLVDAFKLFLKGYKNIIMWFQGVEPDESYMTHKSKLRFRILSWMEKYTLRKSVFSFFVSEAMKEHYEKKYGIRFDSNYYCMPCQNTTLQETAFEGNLKYTNNVFSYVGSLAPWQKFNETVALYKRIEQLSLTNMELRVFTPNQEEAKRILMKAGIKRFTVSFVDSNELSKALSDVKYGFIIRDDNIVNNVATPTKISTYLSCGVIPIYSSCLVDFNRIAENMRFVISDSDNIYKKLEYFEKNKISKKEIMNEYRGVFEQYYDCNKHKNNIVQKLNNAGIKDI